MTGTAPDRAAEAPWPAGYRPVGPSEVEHFRARGWLVLEDAVPAADLEVLRGHCLRVEREPELAFDASKLPTPAGQPAADPSVHSTLSIMWPRWREAAVHAWAARATALLMGRPTELWFDQVLFKPPGGGAGTPWHQDDPHMGASAYDLLVSCWLALDDVGPDMGCLEVLDRAHDRGVLPDLLAPPEARGGAPWTPDPARVVPCPVRRGGVVFHHGKTPHMTRRNGSGRWRRTWIQHFTLAGAPRPTEARHAAHAPA